MREVDRGDRVGFEAAGVEDDEVGGFGGHVQDGAHEPALGLGGSVGDEDEFAGEVTVAEIVFGAGVGLAVKAMEAGGAAELGVAVGRNGDGVDVSVRLAEAVMTGEADLAALNRQSLAWRRGRRAARS